jgi:hypothetical protein
MRRPSACPSRGILGPPPSLRLLLVRLAAGLLALIAALLLVGLLVVLFNHWTFSFLGKRRLRTAANYGSCRGAVPACGS